MRCIRRSLWCRRGPRRCPELDFLGSSPLLVHQPRGVIRLLRFSPLLWPDCAGSFHLSRLTLSPPSPSLLRPEADLMPSGIRVCGHCRTVTAGYYSSGCLPPRVTSGWPPLGHGGDPLLFTLVCPTLTINCDPSIIVSGLGARRLGGSLCSRSAEARGQHRTCLFCNYA